MNKFESNKEFVHSRKEFERSGHLLNEGFHRDKIKIYAHMTLTIKSIKRTRVLPNQRLDLATVNEFARNVSNFSDKIINHSSGKNDQKS
ncbi:hypothetical protein [Microscilla marina]|uniref:hypothetical protein n=1 Tax=Microscilla marina TaxID=1027 RepID=UPI0005D47073|nr:hypothetical protein [Microscilla marina]